MEQVNTKEIVVPGDQAAPDEWHISVDRNQIPNAFEFVSVASARAKQLLQGCVPKVAPSVKPARTAQREVLGGFVHAVESSAPGQDDASPNPES